jgi:hypothetical protein
MSKFGVWAYIHVGDIEAETQGEAQAASAQLVAATLAFTEATVQSIDVYPADDDGGGVCC